MAASVCDALVVAFSEGVSLRTWRDSGSLEREWALYERMRPHVGRIVLVTNGGADDLRIGAGLGPSVAVICNEAGLEQTDYLRALPERTLGAAQGARRIVVKTNQMTGGDAALRIASGLRAAGREVGLVARGGYLWSQFAACEHGADSGAARSAGEREGRLCRGADMVVGTTRQMTADLAWRHGLPERALEVIPNYVLDQPRAPSERDEATVLCAGRLEPQKRVDRLIEAVSLLPEPLRGRITLAIVGAGTLEKQLRAFAEELGVEASFDGRLSHGELLGRMRRCTVYAQTSAYEGHPKTVLEAMASAAPVLVVDEPGLRNVVRHGVSGLCVPPEPRAIAVGLEAVLRDEEWRRTMGQAAADQARSECSLGRVVGLELGVYQRALESGARAGRAAGEGEVAWEPSLTEAEPVRAAATWARSLRAYTRRLEPRRRAEFLAALDAPVYIMQGEAAIEAEGGLHPKHRVMRYHDFFTDRVRPGERVIDLGCGVGALAASIAERSRATVTGMDWTEQNLEKARTIAVERGLAERLSYVRGDITTERAPGGFDVVVLSNVLEHLTDRPERLRQWREWYGARRFLVRVPAFDREWRVPWKKELGVEWRLDATHETEYTQAQLEEELRRAGLRPTELVARWGEYWADAGLA
jgi:SAM-dependent methyltransferase